MNQAIIHTYTLEGLTLQTGDLICTTDGKDDILPGQFWRLVGKLVPGDVDHVIVYVGPEGRCIEAGALGVIAFDIPDGRWQVEALAQRRGMLFDTLWGVAYPLAERGLAPDAETLIRRQVADYCLMQAQARKPYNVNFFDSQTEQAFYCSQLAYKAYLPHGIDLNSGLGVPNLPGGEAIVFPQEIWAACVHQRFA